MKKLPEYARKIASEMFPQRDKSSYSIEEVQNLLQAVCSFHRNMLTSHRSPHRIDELEEYVEENKGSLNPVDAVILKLIDDLDKLGVS